MTTKILNPKIDWGFYAAVPRIVRTGYKNLSSSEKWLYVCLKDLCGDKGVCYRALRVLAQETDLSIASLSTMIRKLHDEGLIHAEKKRRNNNPTAKEVWHISIVDIWQTNAKECSAIEHSLDNVQLPNNNVQEMSNNVQLPNVIEEECSAIEQQCSNFSDRSNNNKNNSNEERTEKEESGEADALTTSARSCDALDKQAERDVIAYLLAHQHTPSLPQEQVTCHEADRETHESTTIPIASTDAKPATRRDEKPAETSIKAKPVMPSADAKWGTRTCMQLFDAWRGAHLLAKYKLQQASSTCKALAENYTREQIEQVYEAMSNEPFWQDKGGPDFDNVANNIAREIKKLERSHLRVMPGQKQPVNQYTARSLDKDHNAQQFEKMKKALADKQAASK